MKSQDKELQKAISIETRLVRERLEALSPEARLQKLIEMSFANRRLTEELLKVKSERDEAQRALESLQLGVDKHLLKMLRGVQFN